MKKYISLFLLVLTYASHAQIIVEQDSLGVNFVLNPEEEAEVVDNKITNNTTNDTLIWTRVNNAIPEGWFSAACTEETCFFPETESGIMVVKQGMQAKFSAYFYPQEIEGAGEVWFSFKPKYSLDSIVVKFRAAAQKPNATEKELELSYGVYPTQFDERLFTSDLAVNYEILTMDGEIVVLPTQQYSFDSSIIQSGLYLVKHTSGLVMRVIKE